LSLFSQPPATPHTPTLSLHDALPISRHERVEDRSLVHSQPGHDRHAEGGEDLRLASTARPPRDLAAEVPLGIAGDPDAVVTGLLPEAVDPGEPGRRTATRRRTPGQLDV